jgi:hypothetical protein
MTSVGSILGGAFGLVRREPLAVLVWALLYLAAMALLLLAMRPAFEIYADLISSQLAAAPGKPLDPQALQPYIARLQAVAGIGFLGQIGLFALQTTLFTAAQRAVLRPAERRFFYLRFGMAELIQMGLAFLLIIGLSFGSLLAMLILGIVVGIAAAASGSPAVAVLLFAISFLVLMGGTIYVMVRLSLAFPLTFIRGDLVIGESWRLGRGRFWPLFGAYFVIMIVQQLLAMALLALAFAPVVSEAMQSGGTPEAAQLAFRHQMEHFVSLDPGAIAIIVGFGLLTGFGIALFGGAVATAARDLTGGEGRAVSPA